MGASVAPQGGGGKRGRRRVGSGSAGAPMAEINVTPFVDVMLVLLIIFMVSAPLLTAAPPDPEVYAELEEVLDVEAVPHVVIEPSGDVLVAGRAAAPEEAPALLADTIEDPARDMVIVQSLAGAEHETVLRLMRALVEGGYEQIGLAGPGEIVEGGAQ